MKMWLFILVQLFSINPINITEVNGAATAKLLENFIHNKILLSRRENALQKCKATHLLWICVIFNLNTVTGSVSNVSSFHGVRIISLKSQCVQQPLYRFLPATSKNDDDYLSKWGNWAMQHEEKKQRSHALTSETLNEANEHVWHSFLEAAHVARLLFRPDKMAKVRAHSIRHNQ